MYVRMDLCFEACMKASEKVWLSLFQASVNGPSSQLEPLLLHIIANNAVAITNSENQPFASRLY